MEVAGVVLPPRRLTIWERIVDQVPGAERDEVREILGARLVEKNEGLCLELDALREILVEFQQQNREFRDRLRSRPPLPEHPARVLLEQQILLLLNSVKKSESIHAKALLQPTSRADREVCNYVLAKHAKRSLRDAWGGSADGTSRPGTSCGTSRSDMYANRRRPGTASSAHSAASFASAPVEVMDALDGKKLSVFAIDKITKDLRAALEAEAEDLLQDIEQVQELLELEHEDITVEKKEALQAPPALEDMREYSAKLEKTWLLEDLESSSKVPTFLAAKRKENLTSSKGSQGHHSQPRQRHSTGSAEKTGAEAARRSVGEGAIASRKLEAASRGGALRERAAASCLSPRASSRTVSRLHFAVNSSRQSIEEKGL